ncbi:MAG TPA: TraR/DksA C4-type zinc finger protein [Kiritimatiellia bacterium]|nr:TraR/DksA C4-type zinc finger protein [Kiritimatiellia bacterium]HNS82048.1 TraR/DksA C4-type zinc finger protein [Kiritimatiellia bacterium]
MSAKKAKKAVKKKAVSAKKPAKKAAVKKAARKPAARKPVKKSVAKKPVRKSAVKKPVKKVARKAAKKPAKKAAVKKAARKPAAKKPAAKKAAASKPAKKPEVKKPLVTVKVKFTAKQIKIFRQRLHELRDRVVDGINFLAGDNLTRSPRDSAGDLSNYSLHMADQGTDNFDREFALSQLSGEQDVIYEIDEALQRLNEGSYGVCEDCGCAIGQERLLALPFARRCIKCKAIYEKVHTKYRPLGPPVDMK